VIRNSKLVNNTIGLFWCWGVKFGLAEDNVMEGNSNYGISIGHCDTDNVMRNNQVRNSGKVGILFRDDARGQDFWANRNLLENNKVVDSGGEDGVAIDIHGQTRDTRIVGNEIVETRQPMKRTGIRIAGTAGEVKLDANTIRGFATDVNDQRGKGER
jgi:parallel beta-helix repeat protein